MRRTPGTPLRLDRQLCFAMYAATQAVTSSYRQGLAAIGLSYSQYLVMMVLWEHGSVPTSVLCRELHVDRAALAALLADLEEKGLLSREARAGDESGVEVRCTPAGEELEERAAAVQCGVEAATGLDGPDLVRLREELHEVTRRLREDPGTG